MTTTATIQDDIDAGRQSGHVVNIRPELAQFWLRRNANNRNLRDDTVLMYAADMEAGNWLMTGEAIKFDTSGNLLDGQHRLHAIVTAGVPVRMMVMTGITPEAQRVMDSGVKRTASDALRMSGQSNAALLAAAARLAIAYEAGEFTRAQAGAIPPVSHSQVVDWIDLNPDIHAAATAVHGGVYFGRSRAAGAFALHRIARIDRDLAFSLFADLRDLRTTGKGDPRSALAHRLVSSKVNRERIGQVTEAHLIFRTWNAIRRGESLKILKTLPTTPFAVPV